MWPTIYVFKLKFITSCFIVRTKMETMFWSRNDITTRLRTFKWPTISNIPPRQLSGAVPRRYIIIYGPDRLHSALIISAITLLRRNRHSWPEIMRKSCRCSSNNGSVGMSNPLHGPKLPNPGLTPETCACTGLRTTLR